MKGIRISYRVGCKAILVLAVFGLIIFGCYAQYTKEETMIATVYSVTVQQQVSGNKDGFLTLYKYIVSTDKGMMQVQPDGIMSSTAFGQLKEGKRYRIRTRGYSFPVVGVYPYIIDAKEKK